MFMEKIKSWYLFKDYAKINVTERGVSVENLKENFTQESGYDPSLLFRIQLFHADYIDLRRLAFLCVLLIRNNNLLFFSQTFCNKQTNNPDTKPNQIH